MNILEVPKFFTKEKKFSLTYHAREPSKSLLLTFLKCIEKNNIRNILQAN